MLPLILCGLNLAQKLVQAAGHDDTDLSMEFRTENEQPARSNANCGNEKLYFLSSEVSSL